MILEQLQDMQAFTPSENQIVTFIREHADVATRLNLEELSAECHVSQASVVRFCKKLGTKGYSDFRIRLAGELSVFAAQGKEISIDIPIRPKATVNEIGDTFYSLSRQALESVHHDLDPVLLSQAAGLIRNADLVHLYGRGESLILAEDLAYKLMRIGKRCQLEALNGFVENRNLLPAGPRIRECAVVISQYCDSSQVRYLIDSLTAARIPFILVTAAEKLWPYDKYAHTVLKIRCRESREKMGCFASRTAFLYLLDCLYGIVFAKDYEENREHMLQSARQKAGRSYFYWKS